VYEKSIELNDLDLCLDSLEVVYGLRSREPLRHIRHSETVRDILGFRGPLIGNGLWELVM